MPIFASEETILLFSSLLLGFLFGLYYEVFRLIRLALPHSSLAVGVEDLLFFLPVSLVYILFCYAFSSGLIRWFSILALFLGFLIYLCTLGKILLFFSDKIILLIKGILKAFFRFLILPIYNVFKNITIYLFTRIKSFAIILEKKKAARRLLKEKKNLISRAGKGF